MFVFEGDGISDVLQEVAVGYGQLDFAAVVFEVIAKRFGDREDGFFPGWLIRLSGGDQKVIAELHVPD